MMFQSVDEWLREKEKVAGREGLKYENLARQLAWLLVLGYGIILWYHLAELWRINTDNTALLFVSFTRLFHACKLESSTGAHSVNTAHARRQFRN